MRRLLISTQKSNRSRKGLEIFERIENRRNSTDGASSGKNLMKRPMSFLDPPDDCRITTRTTKTKKKHFKNSSSLSSAAGTGGPISSPRRRTKKWCDVSLPPVPPVLPPHKMIDLRQDHESTDSSFDAEENDLLLLEPIELSEVVLPKIEPTIELKNSLPQQGHAHQQQPQGSFGEMRSSNIRYRNIDNYSAIQQHHHPQQHQHQHQHIAHQQQQERSFEQMRSSDIRYRNTIDNYSATQQPHHPTAAASSSSASAAVAVASAAAAAAFCSDDAPPPPAASRTPTATTRLLWTNEKLLYPSS